MRIFNEYLTKTPSLDRFYDEEKVWCVDSGGKPYFVPNGWSKYNFVPVLTGKPIDQFRMS
jgi:hypothetical protein